MVNLLLLGHMVQLFQLFQLAVAHLVHLTHWVVDLLVDLHVLGDSLSVLVVLFIHLVYGRYLCSNYIDFFSLCPKGTATGITCSIQMIGMGISNVIVGKMLDVIT